MPLHVARTWAKLARRLRAAVQAERDLRRLFVMSPDALCVGDDHGRMLRVSTSLCDMLGYRPHELSGQNLHNLLHPDDRARSLPALSRLQGDTPHVFKFESRCRTQDGEYRWLSWHASYVPRDKIFYATARDVTQVRLRRQAHALLQSMVDASADLIYIKDVEGRYIYVNAPMLALLGHPASEVLGKHREEIFPGTQPCAPEGALQAPFTPDEKSTIEQRYRIADEDRYLRIRKTPLHDAEGTLLGLLCVTCDITAQRRLEQALRDSEAAARTVGEQNAEQMSQALRSSEARFQSVFNHASVGISLFAVASKRTTANPAYARIVGYTQEELATLPWERFVHPDDLATCYRAITALHQGLTTHCDVRYVHRDGHIVWVQLNAVLVPGVSDTPAYVIIVVQDVTAAKLGEAERSRLLVSERAAIEASQLKSNFVANMSHEIRTPLNGILGLTDVLLDTPLTEEQTDYIGAIKQSGESLLAIVNDVLDLSKVEAGKIELELIDFDMLGFLRSLERLMAPMAARKGLTLQLEVAPEAAVTARGDPNRLRQVLANLLTNAIKFTHHGSVLLRVEVAPQEAKYGFTFAVTDTGPGMSQDVLTRLFTPFMQADTSTTRRFGGTGLGLSICKHLVALMGGTLQVRSTLNEGSTFTCAFCMPCGEGTQPLPELSPPLAMERRHILVADDNAINQLVATKSLERLGHRVTVVANGQQALDALRDAHFDMILMDCQMPELDGYDTTRAIREMGQHPNLPIVAMTASALAGDRERCLAAGMDAYITKPLAAGALEEILRAYLG